MAMSIGAGAITGLSAGGLPDATVTTADIVDANVTAAKLSGAQSGAAPVYGARAWCNFNGTTAGTNAPTAGGNVSTVTRNGVGDYTVNFTTAMADANYAVSICGGSGSLVPVGEIGITASFPPTASALRFGIRNSQTGALSDSTYVTVIIFR